MAGAEGCSGPGITASRRTGTARNGPSPSGAPSARMARVSPPGRRGHGDALGVRGAHLERVVGAGGGRNRFDLAADGQVDAPVAAKRQHRGADGQDAGAAHDGTGRRAAALGTARDHDHVDAVPRVDDVRGGRRPVDLDRHPQHPLRQHGADEARLTRGEEAVPSDRLVQVVRAPRHGSEHGA